MNIVLLEPEIPANTGNIGRTCVLTCSKLHLIKPLGFSLDEKSIRRSGLDYWPELNYEVYESYEDFLAKNIGANIYFATTKTNRKYCDVKYGANDFIMFGKESKGIPAEILERNSEKTITIPMVPNGRSLNLSNAAAIILYEALRQNNFSF